MRFHPGPARVKQLLEAGAIGRVIAARIVTGSYLPDWRPGTDYRDGYSASTERGGGAILDCIHEIDLALWYFGPARLLAAATAPAETIGLPVEGTAELLLRHDSGTLSSVHLNFVQRDYRRGCEVMGSEGSLYWDFNARSVRCVTPVGTRVFDSPPDWELDQMYRDEVIHFLECVESRRPAPNSAGDSRQTLRIALQARSGKAWEGGV
jgi:predicted dehydrogenase